MKAAAAATLTARGGMSSTAFGLDSVGYHPGGRQAPHAHDELQISLVLRGSLEERVGGALELASALSVVVKDPGVVHADQYGRAGALTARLSFHGAVLADLLEHPARARAWRWTHDARVAAPFLRIVERGLHGDRRFASDDDDVVDLLAAVSARLPASHRAGEPRWLSDAAQQIRDDWRPGLTVRDVARGAGVHPVYFARCVRRWYGTGAADLLRRSRLRYATRAIADSDPTVAAVAHATGYADEAHLCRDFARAFGLPPARYRRLARAFGARVSRGQSS